MKPKQKTLRKVVEEALKEFLGSKRGKAIAVWYDGSAKWADEMVPKIIDIVLDVLVVEEPIQYKAYFKPAEDVMSAIISGHSCKSCKKKFWLSLGHPKWYKEYLRTGYKDKSYKMFEQIARSGKCLNCWIEEDELE